MMKLILTFALFATHNSFAATTDIWEGPGSFFDIKGKLIGSYTLVVENTKDGNHIESVVNITLPDGTIQKQQCSMTLTKQEGWTSKCNHGKGGGHCFGEGLCISYEENSTGKAYATTIVMDGPSEMRLLRTELRNGHAVHFYREKLHKK